METQSLTDSDVQALKDLQAKINDERKRWEGRNHGETENIARARLRELAAETPESRLKKQREREEFDEMRRASMAAYAIQHLREEKQRAWDSYVAKRGERYTKCRLENFDCDGPKQETAMSEINSYCETITARIKAGQNIVLFGPSGTGKDHLLTGLVFKAISAIEQGSTSNFSCEWSDGPSLFAAVRDEIGKNSRHSIVDDLAKCWLLVISDLVPPSAKLTDFQSEVVYRIIDSRYSRMATTFFSINVRNRQELDAALGIAVADRLIDGALTISCDWPSYRKSERSGK